MSIQITRRCCVCQIHNPNEIFVNWNEDAFESKEHFSDHLHKFYDEWMCEDCSDLWEEFEENLLTIKN